jgi:gamma-glutamyltranspeptidase/glutathione hydrolase
MQRRFGALPFSRCVEDAVGLAREGFPMGAGLASTIAATRPDLSPAALAAFGADGRGGSPVVGAVLRQEPLARVLEGIASGGPAAFYDGPPARAIREEMARGGVVVEEEDLSSFRPEWCEPLRMAYRGTEVFEVPPNSMGATALLILRLLEETDLSAAGARSAERVRATVGAARAAYAARDRELGDPRFVGFDLDRFLGSAGGAGASRRIEPADTTYFAVADGEGNVLSCIQSIFHHFGSRVFVGDCGFFLNNRGSAFTMEGPNALAPRKRPLHTLSALLLSREGRPVFATGCSGGDYRPQQHALLVTNLVDYRMGLQEAIDFPRFLWDGEGTVRVEAGYDGLDGLGTAVERVGYPGRTGVAQGVEVVGAEEQKGGRLRGVCDLRGEGLPAGF